MNKFAVIAMTLAAGLVMWIFQPAPQPGEGWRPAEPAPQIRDVPTVAIEPPKVTVYAPPAKKKLQLPPDIADDPDKYVLTSTRLPAGRRPVTVVTLIDDQTGDVQTITRREPLPWIAAEQTGELRFDYGIKNGFASVGRITLRENMLQIKALHGGVNTSIDTDGTFFAGVGVVLGW